jgi:hypothetical protein
VVIAFDVRQMPLSRGTGLKTLAEKINCMPNLAWPAWRGLSTIAASVFQKVSHVSSRFPVLFSA